MSEPLGFALVGCGEVGTLNARSLASARGSRLVRVVDVDREAARAVAGPHGVEISSSLGEALQDSRVNAVFIATPHDLHSSMIVEAASAGRHAIVEKPLATSLPAADVAIAACERACVSLSVCHPRRYEKKVEFAASLVDRGLVGRVLLTSSLFLKEKRAEYYRRSPWRASRTRSGGGVLIMNLVHNLDSLQVVTGSQIASVMGRLARLGPAPVDVEDTVSLAFAYESGALGTVGACASIPGAKVFQDSVFGTSGRFSIEKRVVRWITSLPSDLGPADKWVERSFEEDADSKTRFIEGFVASVREGLPPPVPAAYGRALLALVTSASSSSEERS